MRGPKKIIWRVVCLVKVHEPIGGESGFGRASWTQTRWVKA